MERLPYIDKHATTVQAHRAATWSALLRMWCRDPADPSAMRYPTFWRLRAADTENRLVLDGAHLFARYRLAFELGDDRAGRTQLSASSWAEFPGVHGAVYRALVIGTGGHRVAVRRMLKHIAAQAEKLESVHS